MWTVAYVTHPGLPMRLQSPHVGANHLPILHVRILDFCDFYGFQDEPNSSLHTNSLNSQISNYSWRTFIRRTCLLLTRAISIGVINY